jgi:hypothetical protein
MSKHRNECECRTLIEGRYSNVSHEVKEVASGCRWVLTYNLVREHSSESSSDSSIAGRKLHAILSDWRQQRAEAANTVASAPERAAKDNESGSVTSVTTKDDVPPNSSVKQAIYYTQSNLSIDSLRGADRLRAKELLSICDNYGCTFYLANLNVGSWVMLMRMTTVTTSARTKMMRKMKTETNTRNTPTAANTQITLVAVTTISGISAVRTSD